MAVLVLALSACGGVASASDPASAAGSETITLYTSTTQETVDALLAAFGEAHPDITVEVFRAPTGEINARIAAEQREGAVRGDVLWLSDPLSIQQYDADGLLREWTPTELDAVPEAYRTERFWGTRLLNVVLIHGADIDPAPVGWADLADPAYADSVAIIDPGFAGSAFGALGYFATSDEFGFDFYRDLAANGADQLSAPDEVVTASPRAGMPPASPSKRPRRRRWPMDRRSRSSGRSRGQSPSTARSRCSRMRPTLRALRPSSTSS